MTLISNFFYTVLATVFKFKMLDDKHKESLPHSTKQNKKMLEIQKLHRFLRLVRIRFEKYYRRGSLCILLGNQVSYQPLFYDTLTRTIKD